MSRLVAHLGGTDVLAAAASEDGFHAPGVGLFQFEPLFTVAGFGVTKPMALAILSALIVVAFFYAATARSTLVPSRLQSLAEIGYVFIRDEVARSIIGKRGDRYVPLLISLFFLIWMMNLFSVIPLAQFPPASRIAYPAILALIVYVTFLAVGIKHQGLVGYFRNMMFPPGIPKPVYVILAPLELISTMLVRPFTLAVRLFANMFAGHVLLAFFAIVGWYFIVEAPGPGIVIGVVGVIMTVVMTAFEMFIQALQAYIFTLLAAVYIQSSVEVHH